MLVIKVDQATLHRDKLLFARVLVEATIDQPFPDYISFMNEVGIRVDQKDFMLNL